MVDHVGLSHQYQLSLGKLYQEILASPFDHLIVVLGAPSVVPFPIVDPVGALPQTWK